MAKDVFKNLYPGLNSPASAAAQITPNDAQDLAWTTRALYIGSVGDVSVVMVDGTEAVFKNAVGLLPLRVSRVKVSGTTATHIVGLA